MRRAFLVLALLLVGCESEAPSYPPVEVGSQDLAIQIYDVTDILSARSELELDASIRRETGGDELWREPASIEFHRGQMIVNQSPEVHRRILDALHELRR